MELQPLETVNLGKRFLGNTQPVEKVVYREDGSVELVSAFLTIQGEGFHAGRPAVFIRLAGCSLMCELCDTDYTTNRRLRSVEEITKEVQRLYPATHPSWEDPLVVITGGEPFRQGLGFLCRDLQSLGYNIQVETNGTVYDNSMEGFWSSVKVVCSPKTPTINDKLKRYIDALKYVVKAGEIDPIDGLPTSSLLVGSRPARPWEGFEGSIYIQPCDELDPEKNKVNTQAAIDTCMKFGYVMGIQMHKILNLP